MRQFDKNMTVKFSGARISLAGEITYANDRGPRMTFSSRRTMRADPDTATLRIYNMPQELARALAADVASLRQEVVDVQKIVYLEDEKRAEILRSVVESYQVEVFAGWRGNSQLVFRGDPIEVRPRVRDGNDYVTEIDLGDAFVVLQETQLKSQFSAGETPAGLIAWVLSLADATADREDLVAQVGQVAPNAAIGRMANGFIAVGRPLDAIRTLSDLYAANFWVKDGSVFMVERDKVLKDFAIVLDERKNLLTVSEPNGRFERYYRAIASPSIHPGRGCVVRQLDGSEFKARIIATELNLDTHGEVWEAVGMLSQADFLPDVIVTP